MKTIQIVEPGEIRPTDCPVPKLPPDKVLLKINRIGYCGSDLAAFRGLNPLVTYPRIPGHEIGATIDEVGHSVRANWKVGQQVSVIPYANCGKCAACLLGRPNCCKENKTLGVQCDGAMAEYFVAAPEKLIASPTLSLRELALIEPLTVGSHAVSRGQVSNRDTVGVFGCGAIGLGAIAAAHFAGARVIAIDIDDGKLAQGRACGAAETVNSQTENLHDQLQALTGGHGPSVMIEAVGSADCYQAAVDEVSSAGRVVYIGWAKAPVEYNTTPFVYKELDIRGSRNALRPDFDKVIAMLEQGKFPLDEVVTSTVSIDDAAVAMQDWDANPRPVTKIHVELD